MRRGGPSTTGILGLAAICAAACGGGARRAAPAPPAVASAAATASVEPVPDAVSVPAVVVEPSAGVRARLPRLASGNVESVRFSADSKTIDVVRAGGSLERYDLATATRLDAATPVEPAPEPPSRTPLTEDTRVTVQVGPAERRTLTAVAKEIGGSLDEVDEGTVALSHPERIVGTDGSRFVWFDSANGKTLVRLDTGARKSFVPWTNGFSGMGMRTGGTIVFDFGPNIDRALVGSWSQMGATVGMDQQRLVDTRTMTDLGALPTSCDADFSWSARGSFVARCECWTRRLMVADGRTGANLRIDEPLQILAFAADESLLAGRTLNGGLLVERSRSGEPVLRLAGPDAVAVTDVLFSRDGKRLVFARGSSIDVWDLETGAGRTLDTHGDQIDLLTTDVDVTAAWMDGHWIGFTGKAPTAPPAATSVGGFDTRKLAGPDEAFEVLAALPRPGTKQIFIAGTRTKGAAESLTPLGKRFAVVDLASGVVEHVYDDDTLDERDWAWTIDGAHLVTRAVGSLAILTPDLRLEPVEQPPPMHPTQPIRRLVEMFGTADGIARAAEVLGDTTIAPIGAPRAVHPRTRFFAAVVSGGVMVLDLRTGARLVLSCADLEATRGCLATTNDGRFDASPSIAPLVVRDGAAREAPGLVKTFFAAAD